MRVVHLIDRHAPEDLLEQLALLRRPEEPVVCLGAPPEYCPAGPDAKVHRPLWGPWLRWRCAPRALRGADVFHAWSVRAAGLLPQDAPQAVILSLAHVRPSFLRRCGACWAPPGPGRTTVPCPADWDRLIQAGARAEAVRVLPPPAPAPAGAEVRRAVRGELGLSEGQILLAAPAPMTRSAGVRYGPWAHAILRQMRDDLRLILPGGGAGERNARFYTRSAGYAEEVFLTGRRYGPAEVLAAADVALFPFEQDCGLWALAAAMAAGLPIVASRTPQVVEATGGGDAAVLVGPGQAAELSAGLMRLLDDPALRRQLASAAKARAADQFDPARSRARLEDIYASCASASPGSPSRRQ